MKAARIVLGVVVAALGAWLLVAVFTEGGSEPPAGPPIAFQSSAECAACHAEVHARWQASQHAMAWTNPAVRLLSNDFANQDCIDCHAPQSVFVTGIGERVLPRAVRRVEGVDCISCHLLPDGRVAGTITDPSAPCRPVETRELLQPELCAGCHNQHQTVDQWHASQWPARGQDCLDCHMPALQDGRRDHAFPGGNQLWMLQAAVDLRGEPAPEGGWRVVLENVGAGHSFPTDERSRAADLFWRPLGEQRGRWRHLYRIRDPYRYETDLVSTLLPAGGTLELDLPQPDGREAVEVALFYKRSPYYEDPDAPDPEREAILVERIELVP